MTATVPDGDHTRVLRERLRTGPLLVAPGAANALAARVIEEVLAVPERIPAPQLVNLVEGGQTPQLPLSELEDFGIALFANVALQGAIKGMQRALGTLYSEGSIAAAAADLAPWAERQRMVAKPYFDSLDTRYSAATSNGAASSIDPQRRRDERRFHHPPRLRPPVDPDR